jgi:very-short-patch-repair endonuclease
MSAMTLRALHPLAERQHGIFHIRQIDRLATIGVVRSAVRRGELVAVRPHVFRFAGTPATWEQSVLAAVLVAGDAAVASHATAAALLGLDSFRVGSSTPIHVAVPRGRHGSIDAVRVHTTKLGPGCHRTVVDRIAVTHAARTLCDLDGEVPDWRLARVVDDALMRKLVSIEVLAEVHAELRRGSRRSRGMARILAERGAEWDEAESPGEARLVRWLVAAGLPRPVQQHVVDGYRVDLAYPEHGVFIEYDGFDPHSTRNRFDHDRRRANHLALRAGATVLHFTSGSTRQEVVRDVRAALSHRHVA